MEVSKVIINGQTAYDRKTELTKKFDLATSAVSVAKKNYEDAKDRLAEFKDDNEELLNEYAGIRKQFNTTKTELANALLEYYEINSALEEIKE